jgi:hypothetical protein
MVQSAQELKPANGHRQGIGVSDHAIRFYGATLASRLTAIGMLGAGSGCGVTQPTAAVWRGAIRRHAWITSR